MTDLTGEASTTLFIDDDLTFASGAAAALSSLGATAAARHPSQVTPEDVTTAVLVILDEYLDEWQRPTGPATANPADGLAVGGVLQSQKPSLCVAILTGDLVRLADGVPVAFGEHHIAALRDVEWVFSKGDAQYTARIEMLAEAVHGLPKELTPAALIEWLRVPDQPWRIDAVEHITRCRPPVAPRQRASASRPVLRWLLQRALPYPTFLLTDRRASLALGVDVSMLDDLLGANAMAACVYDGPLAEFLGRRWWRAGIDDLLETPSKVPGLVELQSSQDLLLVLPLGDGLEELAPSSVEECVRIYPDGWPSFADQAWALRSDIFAGSLQHDMLGLADPLWTET